MKTIYLASGNVNKLRELQTALTNAGLPIRVSNPDEIGGMPNVEETGSTFQANALLKAEGLRRMGPSEAWYLADDSGIEIDALGGRPGVISARYAGLECDDEANNDKVIKEMSEVPETKRTCRFQCVLALLAKEKEHFFSGTCEGRLLFEGRGKDGFGYDPLFLPIGSAGTFAEILPAEKAKISHRARAMSKLINWLASGKVL